ncbi:malectin, partial [Shewanella sp. A25]|nr:malectin [Shewanella shenzhenensis]
MSRTWVAYTAFSGGKTYSNGVAIAGTGDDALYQSERYGDFSYAIPAAATGCYSVALHFAEIWFGGPGGGGDGS